VGGATAPPGKADAKVTATIDEPQVSSDEGRQAVLVGYGVANEDGLATRKHRRQGAAAPQPASAPQPAVAVASTPGLAPRSTPPVRLYAKQQGVDLALLHGTGRDGLITRDDVERALHTNGAPHRRPSSSQYADYRPHDHLTLRRSRDRVLGDRSQGGADRGQGVLRSMSDAMVQSAFSAPHAAVWVRVDATRTVELLESLKKHPISRAYASRRSPSRPWRYATRHETIRVSTRVSTRRLASGGSTFGQPGIAAATDRGLIVPNIKGADELDLVAMANALNTLVDTARQGTTTPNEMIGTTLTITNVGPMGVDAAMPILPPGTGAIVAIGQIAKAPGWSRTPWWFDTSWSWPCPSTIARSMVPWRRWCSRTSAGTSRTRLPRSSRVRPAPSRPRARVTRGRSCSSRC